MVETDLGSSGDRYTPVADFYVRDHYDSQGFGTGSLRIEGEVEEPQELTLDRLIRLPQRELGAVMECAGNLVGASGLVSNGLWRGLLLRDVVSLARPRATGAWLNLFGRDTYARSVHIGRAYEYGMLATQLNRRPLTRNHGFPWRAVFPGLYGMNSVKWLERIEVSATPLPVNEEDYIEITKGPAGDLSRQALPAIQVKSVIVAPADESVLSRGRMELQGLAWSGAGRIRSVVVTDDGGTNWVAATLDPVAGHEWTRWRCLLELRQLGKVEFECRATDDGGFTQPLKRDPARLDGYANNWYHRIRCVVV
jgi:DMSO/TMAO reductase YedYZ molybdopterin-dependent catalytic subunit